jgi:pimeloyl-ACP methyl ester carboxylesterase
MRYLVLLFFLATAVGLLSAQEPPYTNAPPVHPPYFRVRYEVSLKPGELPFPVSYTIWIPPGLKTLRGVVVHQHGCGEGSCKSGQTGAFDLHWQALARKHACALISPTYEQPEKADCQLWCDPRNGSDAAFQKSLLDLGTQSGHPELASVPWALWGHSGGGTWSGAMTLLHPDRVVAAWLRSGVPPIKPVEGKSMPLLIPSAALKVPVMCNLGTKEGVTFREGPFAKVWDNVEPFFRALRSKGGLAAVAVDPLSSHECGNQRYLAIPWLDACLSARLPKGSGQPLRSMPEKAAWLVPLNVKEPNAIAPLPASKFSGERDTSVWLPNVTVAKAWAQYVKDTAVVDTTPPPAPFNVRIKGNELTWEAEADVESGLALFIIERDGQWLTTVPEQAKNPFGRAIFQNLQYSDTPTQPLVQMRFEDTTAQPGGKHRYGVIAVNTAGLKSKPATSF